MHSKSRGRYTTRATDHRAVRVVHSARNQLKSRGNIAGGVCEWIAAGGLQSVNAAALTNPGINIIASLSRSTIFGKWDSVAYSLVCRGVDCLPILGRLVLDHQSWFPNIPRNEYRRRRHEACGARSEFLNFISRQRHAANASYDSFGLVIAAR